MVIAMRQTKMGFRKRKNRIAFPDPYGTGTGKDPNYLIFI